MQKVEKVEFCRFLADFLHFPVFSTFWQQRHFKLTYNRSQIDLSHLKTTENVVKISKPNKEKIAFQSHEKAFQKKF